MKILGYLKRALNRLFEFGMCNLIGIRTLKWINLDASMPEYYN